LKPKPCRRTGKTSRRDTKKNRLMYPTRDRVRMGGDPSYNPPATPRRKKKGDLQKQQKDSDDHRQQRDRQRKRERP